MGARSLPAQAEFASVGSNPRALSTSKAQGARAFLVRTIARHLCSAASAPSPGLELRRRPGCL